MSFPLVLIVGIGLCVYLYKHGRKGDATFGAIVLGLCTLVHLFIAMSNAMHGGSHYDIRRHGRTLSGFFDSGDSGDA